MEQEHNEAVAFQQEIINTLTEKVNFLQDKIEQMHIFVAEKDKYIIEKDRRPAELEQQYYTNANPRHTLSYQEKPYYEHEDALKFNKHNNKEWNHNRPRHHVTSEPSTPKNINANSGWENLHNSSNMDLDRKSEMNENHDQIDNKLNAKAKKPTTHDLVEQELEVEIRDKENDTNGVSESIHSPTTNKDIKYYAGKIRALINMEDQEIVNQINNGKYLAYHLTKCGLSINKGNQYLTLGFFTESDRDSFINNNAITQIFGGKFQPMNQLDKIERHVNIRIEELEETVTMDDLKLENLWSIQSLKQSLRRYKFVLLDDRHIKWNKKQPVYLQLKGIQQDQVNLTELADEIAKRNAIYWKKEDGNKGSWVITVAFKNNEAREMAKEDQITINGTKLAWHQLIKDNIQTRTTFRRIFLKDDSITNKKTTEVMASSPFVVTTNKENTKNVNIKATQDNITTMDTVTNEHNRNNIDNNTIEKVNEVDNMIIDDNILMNTIADQMVRMNIEDVRTIKHKDIMNTQTINAKITNIDTTEQQVQIKSHYISKSDLDNNTHNINNITNKDSVMDVTDLINQDMDVDSQIVSGEENEEREIRYRNNKNNYNTNKKFDNKNNKKKYNKKLGKNRKEKFKIYNKINEKVTTKEKTKKEISTLNICTFNARGINDTKKQELISQLIQTEEWDIVNINETKLTTRKGEFAFNNIKKEFR
ncbi:unnamed protein product [Rhizophagus irregularis]|nr:unnamed protein product [Rhizophagus irregularis]